MLFNHIVVGLDFRSPSLNAARFALRRFRPQSVTLVHVLRDDARTFDSAPAAGDALSRLRALAETLNAPQARVDVVTGSVPEQLQSIAIESHADLVCIGAARESGAKRLGATVRALIAAADVPVLIVPHNAAGGCVHAVWSGVNAAENVMRTASVIADAWAHDLSALCFLPDDAWCTSDPDGLEQRRLAHVLFQANVIGVETVRVDPLRGAASVGRGLTSYINVHGPGLIACDGWTARLILASGCYGEAVAPDAPEIPRILAQCPLLTVFPPRRAPVLGNDHDPSHGGGQAA